MKSGAVLKRTHMKKLSIVITFLLLAGCATIPSNESLSDNLFYAPQLSKQEVYPDEEILMTYELFTRYDIRYEGHHIEPETYGFWIYHPPVNEDVKREIRTVAGRRFVVAEVSKMHLFPMGTGAKTIKPAVLKVTYRVPKGFWSFSLVPFERKETFLEVPVLEVRVKPFPENDKPKNFTGSSGNYFIKAFVDDSYTGSGMVPLKLIVEGKGNFWGLELPPLDLGKDFKVVGIKSYVEANADWNTPTVKGSKTFQIDLIPTKTGKLLIPPVPFSYFNTEREKYETVQTAPISVTVENLVADEAMKQVDNGMVVLLDFSGSMLAEDAGTDRLTAAKRIAQTVIEDKAPQWVNVIVFARETKSLNEENKIDRTELSKEIENFKQGDIPDGTAIGSAMYEAVQELDKRVKKSGKKTIVLIGDGRSNAGYMDEKTALGFVKQSGIVMHTVSIGRGGFVPFPVNDPVKGKVYVTALVNTNPEFYSELAEQTGGVSFRVVEAQDVGVVRAELQKLLA